MPLINDTASPVVDLTDPRLKKLAKRVLRTLQLEAEKAVVHHAESKDLSFGGRRAGLCRTYLSVAFQRIEFQQTTGGRSDGDGIGESAGSRATSVLWRSCNRGPSSSDVSGEAGPDAALPRRVEISPSPVFRILLTVSLTL